MMAIDVETAEFMQVLKETQRVLKISTVDLLKKAAYEFTRSAAAATKVSKKKRPILKKFSKKEAAKTGRYGLMRVFIDGVAKAAYIDSAQDNRRTIKRKGLARLTWWKALAEAGGKNNRFNSLGDANEIAMRRGRGIDGTKNKDVAFIELQNNLDYVGKISPHAAFLGIKNAGKSMAGQLERKVKQQLERKWR